MLESAFARLEATCGLFFMIDDWHDNGMLVSLEDLEFGMSSL